MEPDLPKLTGVDIGQWVQLMPNARQATRARRNGTHSNSGSNALRLVLMALPRLHQPGFFAHRQEDGIFL